MSESNQSEKVILATSTDESGVTRPCPIKIIREPEVVARFDVKLLESPKAERRVEQRCRAFVRLVKSEP